MQLSIRKRRARRLVFTALGLFILVQLVMGLLLDNCWPLVRFPEARHLFERYQQLFANGDSPDVLVLGTSRFELGIHEDALTGTLRREIGNSRLRAFNASVQAGDLHANAFILDHLLALGARPRLLLIEMSPESVHELSPWINFQVLRQLRWQDLPSQANQLIKANTLTSLVRVRLFPLPTYRDQMEESLTELVRNWRELPADKATPAHPCPEQVDWRVSATIPATLEKSVADVVNEGNRFAKWHVNEQYQVGGLSVQALTRILARCRESHITPVMIGAPLSSSHRLAYTPAIEARYLAFIAGLKQSDGVELVDLRDTMPDTAFKDSHHLSPEGAIVFSEKLARESLTPRLRPLAPTETRPPTAQPVSRQSPGIP